MQRKTFKSLFYTILLFSIYSCLRQADLSHPLEKDVFRLEEGKYLVKVKVSGMLIGNELSLQLNGTEVLSFQGDGEKSFNTILKNGDFYQIQVTVPSYRQNCTINPESGLVEKTDIFVEVNCVTVLFLVGGNVASSNPPFSLGLQLNGGEVLILNTGQSFWFHGTLLQNGDAYNVTVIGQPYGGLCTVSNGSGVISGADVQNIQVSCIPWGYSLVSVFPPDWTFLGADQSITIQIDHSFDPANCPSSSLGGNMGAGSYTFSTTNLPNDTITITPLTTWTTGPWRYLHLSNCYALNSEPHIGNSSLTLYYKVITSQNHIRYVKPTGNDASNGLSPQTAKQSFTVAYNELAAFSGCATNKDCVVLLAGGNYPVSSSTELKTGISIFGGYSTDFTIFQPEDDSKKATIDGSSITCAALSQNSPCATFYTTPSLDPSNLKLKGLKIYGPNQNHSAAIKFSAKPVSLDALILIGGNCSAANCTTSGLFVENQTGYPSFSIDYTIARGGDCNGVFCESSGITIDTSFPLPGLTLYQVTALGGVSAANNSKSAAIKLANSAEGTINLYRVQLHAGVSDYTAGIYVNSSNPLSLQINASEISGGSSRKGHQGIWVNSSPAIHSVVVENSIIYGGNLAGGHIPLVSAYAVNFLDDNSTLTLSHNLLMSGNGTNTGIAAAISVDAGILNVFYNHLIPGTGQRQYGIHAENNLPNTYDISYNNFWNIHAYVATNNHTNLYTLKNPTQLCLGDNVTCLSAPGNQNLAPFFANPNGNPPDFHYSPNSPCALTQAPNVSKSGVNDFANDKDWMSRPGPNNLRSIGPYEYEGPCSN